MSSVDVTSDSAGSPPVRAGEMKLEVVVIPVSDVDRAKEFYERLGWRVDADVAPSDDFRLVQVTPPGSGCSVHFGKGLTNAAPGSAQDLHLAVSDIETTRAELVERGLDVGEVFHCTEGFACRFEAAGTAERASGLAPARSTYGSFASIKDPDGNGWLLQEIGARLPGR